MDSVIFGVLHSQAGVSAVVDWFIVMAAAYLPWVLVLAALVLVWKDRSPVRRIEKTVFVALALLVSRGFVTEVIRVLAPRDRPFVVQGFTPMVEQSVTAALPSGHAAVFFALATAVWFMDRRWGYWFGALALVNGVARVAAGVHWPSDILAGAAVGILSALLVRLILNKIPKRSPAS